ICEATGNILNQDSTMMKIAIVSYKKQEKFTQGTANDEDADLIEFLKGKGLDAVPAIWNDRAVDWSEFNVAIIKSPWDYHNHLTAFLMWLDSLDKLGVQVLNPTEIIKWNSHKLYLKDLAERGLSVIPAEYLERGSLFDPHFFEAFSTEKLVLKTSVSASAQNTITISKNNYHEQLDEIAQLIKVADYIVQPFVEEIKSGEWSFLFFNGRYSHCVLKTPKKDDFRVH